LAPALSQGVQALGLALDAEAQDRQLRYLGLIAKWNRVYNLTALREPAEMLSHHLLDSLSVVGPLARHLRERGAGSVAARLLDVGSGAGLPGVVLALVMPELQVTCVDTVGKKAAFIRQAAGELGLRNLRAEHARVEQLQAVPFDVVTSRAFSSLADFVDLTTQHLAPGAVWMAMKAKHPQDELAALPSSVQVFHVEPLQVPGLDAERCLVWMRQVQP
jgi:16S rRNA (guanine527-N7)-methyltransferase